MPTGREPVRTTAPSNPPEATGLTKAKEAYTPDGAELFIRERVLKRIRDARMQPNRLPMDIEAYQGVLFYLGIQWVRYDATQKTILPYDAPAWVPTPVNNEVAPRVDRLQAQFTKGKPTAEVVPKTSEPRDRAAAKVGAAFCTHSDDVVLEDAKRDVASQTLIITGNVYSREAFNPRKGPVVQIPELAVSETPMVQDVVRCPECGFVSDMPEAAGQACPQCGQAPLVATQNEVRDPTGQPVMQPKVETVGVNSYHQGEIESEIILPWAFFHDPNATSIEECEWAAHESYLPLEKIRRMYPDTGKHVGEGARAVNTFYLSALMQLVGPSHPQSATGALPQAGGQSVYTYEEMPNELFEKGLVAIVSEDGVVLDYGDHPLFDEQTQRTELSYSHCRFRVVPGRMEGTTPVFQIIPLNRRLNGMLAQLHLNRVTLLQPWVLNPTTSGIKPGSINMRPALVVDYNPQGGKPEIVHGEPFPSQIYEEYRQCLEAIERIMGTQDVMRGDVPQGVKSGVALNYLGEAAEMTHIPAGKRWEKFIADRYRKRLKLIKKHYTEERLVKVAGEGSRAQVRALSGADLQDNTDVIVETGSSLPRSRTAQIQLAFDGLEAGMVPDPRMDPVTASKLRRDVGLNGYDDEVSPDVERANDEILRMDQGEPVMVTEWENLEIHARIHLAEIKRPSFDDKPEMVKRIHLAHLQMTRQKWFEEQMRQQAARMLRDGAGGGGDDAENPDENGANPAPEEAAGEGAPTGGGRGAPPAAEAPA